MSQRISNKPTKTDALPDDALPEATANNAEASLPDGASKAFDGDISFSPEEFERDAAAETADSSLIDHHHGGSPHARFASDAFEHEDGFPAEDAFPGAAEWNDTDDAWLNALTPAQLEAVKHVDGPLLILAGPGSGKTRVISHRVANLLRQGVAADQILALTFTNKAADELRSRVECIMPGERVWTSTFHRLCAKLLRSYAPQVGLEANFTIYDMGDSFRTLKRVMARTDKWERFTPDQVSKAISWAKNNLVRAEDYVPRSGNPLGAVTAEIYPEYQAELISANAVDFDDLLLHIALVLKDHEEIRRDLDERFRYVLVDEYQDTNLAQYSIVRALCVAHPNLAVTGDPDQSIYGWRGANLQNILDFEHDYPNVRVVRLEQNYRSTQRILSVADRLIRNNVRRKQKELYTNNDAGAPVRYVEYADERDEAESIASVIAAAVREGRRRPRDFAVFYRVNALSRGLEHAFRDQGVPYQIVNGVEFYQRKEIKDVMAYLGLVNNPRDSEAFHRVVNTPTRGIGKTTLKRLGQYAVENHLPMLEAARHAAAVPKLNARAIKALGQFVNLIDSLERLAHQPVEEIVGYVLERTDYRETYANSESEEDHDRLANIDELLTAARQFDERHAGDGYLEGFLEQSSLVNDIDAWAEDSDQVTLMTLHASKGLEFPCVFLIALEQGIIPHERSRDNTDFEEEERRLLFVGMTRAMEELQLSKAGRRAFRGKTGMAVPSSFTMELPREEMDWHQPAFGHRGLDSYPRRPAKPSIPYDAASGVLPTAAQLAGMQQDSPQEPNDQQRSPEILSDPLTQHEPLAGGEETPWGGVIGAEASPAHSPEEFTQGMVVKHPDYGLGKIIALSGEGPNRKATVAFASAAGERKFVLAKSKLSMVKKRT